MARRRSTSPWWVLPGLILLAFAGGVLLLVVGRDTVALVWLLVVGAAAIALTIADAVRTARRARTPR